MKDFNKSKPFNNHEFKKSLGQNFISDKNLLQAIVIDADLTQDDFVLEIGAGAGTLTEIISKNAKEVVSFEVDTSLKADLEKKQSENKNLKVVFKDFLSVEREELWGYFSEKPAKKLKVIANIPYYITSQIVFKLLAWCNDFESITIMVQKEVGERMVASVGGSDYGTLPAVIGCYGSACIKRIVKKQNFYPMPKVDSCIVHIEIFDNLEEVYLAKLSKFIQKCFQNRRKTLYNNLVSCANIEKDLAKKSILTLGLSESVRAENLESKDFAKLYKLLCL